MTSDVPRPESTLAVLLGSREWPDFPSLEPSEAFAASALSFNRYLLQPRGLGLPAENVLDLFDDNGSPADIVKRIAKFLQTRREALDQQGRPAKDLLLYFVGHGAFLGEDQAYHLLLRSSHAVYQRATSLSVADLAEAVRAHARDLRKFVLIDACYAAGAAQTTWQSSDGPEIRHQTLRAFPPKGVALLCSSNRRLRSKAPPGQASTMFTGALLEVLTNHHPGLGEQLSLRQVGELTKDRVLQGHGTDAVRPEVHSPDQRDGDLADVPIFPNPAAPGTGTAPTPAPTHLAAHTTAVAKLRYVAKVSGLLLALLLVLGGAYYLWLIFIYQPETTSTLPVKSAGPQTSTDRKLPPVVRRMPSDAELLQGRWKLVATQEAGKREPVSESHREIEIRDGHLSVRIPPNLPRDEKIRLGPLEDQKLLLTEHEIDRQGEKHLRKTAWLYRFVDDHHLEMAHRLYPVTADFGFIRRKRAPG